MKRSCLNLLTAEPGEARLQGGSDRPLGPYRGGHVSNEQPTELGCVSLLFSHTRGVKDETFMGQFEKINPCIH